MSVYIPKKKEDAWAAQWRELCAELKGVKPVKRTKFEREWLEVTRELRKYIRKHPKRKNTAIAVHPTASSMYYRNRRKKDDG